MLKQMSTIILIIALVVTPPVHAAWTIAYAPPGIQPNSTFNMNGSAEPDSVWTVEIHFTSSNTHHQEFFLCSHGGTTHYMQSNWSVNFSPSEHLNGEDWPISADGDDLWAHLMIGGESVANKKIEVRTPQ